MLAEGNHGHLGLLGAVLDQRVAEGGVPVPERADITRRSERLPGGLLALRRHLEEGRVLADDRGRLGRQRRTESVPAGFGLGARVDRRLQQPGQDRAGIVADGPFLRIAAVGISGPDDDPV
ncbi:hypothetical protein [Kribbella antiqua]|uniref:hypothetical protein n=1 Tax=Kribbella antiqua TaxID=2512217 RepID=UPI0010516E16|nr:hypothetical protein [Kribbella antiqua]